MSITGSSIIEEGLIMWSCFYLLIVCIIVLGAVLASGRQNVLKMRSRNMLRSGARFKSKAVLYSKKLKLREWLKKQREEKIDKEIYESISFLRNIIALGNGRQAGADYIVELLSRKEGILQPVYVRMLRFLRIGKLEDAVKAFSDEALTPVGSEFGSLLLK